MQLQTQAFDSSTQALTKLRTGSVSPDIINTCVDENAAEEVRLGVYQPLDISKIPNWKYIDPALKKLPGVEMNGKVYVIPVDAGDGGIQYDPRHVHPAPTSWKDLFNPKYKGEAAMEDNPVTAIDAGALAIGIKDPLHMTEAQLQQVKNFLIAHRSEFRTWWESDTDEEQLYKTGEIWISSGYRDDAYTVREVGRPERLRPAKGGVAGVDVRLRHQRPRPQRERRLRDAQLVRQRGGRDLRGEDLVLPDRQHQGARHAPQGSACAVRQQPEARQPDSRRPSPRTTPSGCRYGRT